MEDNAEVVIANNLNETKIFKNTELLPAAFTESDL
jgi:hypothetical protein